MIWFVLPIFLLIMGFFLIFAFLDKMRKKRVLLAGLFLILVAVILFESI